MAIYSSRYSEKKDDDRFEEMAVEHNDFAAKVTTMFRVNGEIDESYTQTRVLKKDFPKTYAAILALEEAIKQECKS
jgi:hypothetical protein